VSQGLEAIDEESIESFSRDARPIGTAWSELTIAASNWDQRRVEDIQAEKGGEVIPDRDQRASVTLASRIKGLR
jgi:hypothetical protein